MYVPSVYYENKLQKMQDNPADCVSCLLPAGQSFYFFKCFKNVFVSLEETKMKAQK